MNSIRFLLRNWLGIEADHEKHASDHAKWHEQGKREYQQQLNEQAARYSEQQRLATDRVLAGLRDQAAQAVRGEFWRAALSAGKSPEEALDIATVCMEMDREITRLSGGP